MRRDDAIPTGAAAAPDIRWSLVTVSYNSAEVLRTHWTGRVPDGVEWLVIDNASRDDSVRVAHDLGARVVALDSNLGFGAANNVGFREARGTFVVFVNPDVRVDFDSLAALEVAMSRGGGLVAPQLTFDDGSLQPNGRLAPSLSNKVLSRIGVRRIVENYHVYAAAGESAYVAWVIGAVVAGSRADFEKLGLRGPWDERFFVYYEDSDLGLRAWRAGLPVRVIGSAQWKHSWSRDTVRLRVRPWLLEFSSMTKFYLRYPDLIVGAGSRRLKAVNRQRERAAI